MSNVLETQIETLQTSRTTAANGRSFYVTDPEILEKSKRSQLIDPELLEREDFYEFTELYWLRLGRRLRYHKEGQLTAVEGIPKELVTIDGFRPGSQTTTLSLDASQWRESEFTWRMDSVGRYVKIGRTIVVSADNMSGKIDYVRFVPAPGGGTSEALGGPALSRLIDVTYNLATQAEREMNSSNQLVLPFR